MDGHWKFISEDNHKAVEVGRLALGNNVKESDTAEVHFTYAGAVIREGADEFALRAHEEGVLRAFIGASNV